MPESTLPAGAPATNDVRRFDAVVHVMLRRAILDPQGRAVQATLERLGHDNLESLRVGKRIEVRLRGERSEVEAQLARIASTVLSNPVMEEVRTELHEVPPDAV
jgi:phosphoribosylformylglycinamidine synthase PurS subunit